MEASSTQNDNGRSGVKTTRAQRKCLQCGQLFQPTGQWDNWCSQNCESAYQRDPFDYKCTETFRDYGASSLGLPCLSGRRPVHDSHVIRHLRARIESLMLEVIDELRKLPLKLKAVEGLKPHRQESTDSSKGFFQGIGSGDAA
jgi:hypothetical protein